MTKCGDKHCASVNAKNKIETETSTHAGVTGLDTKLIYIIIKNEKLLHTLTVSDRWLMLTTKGCP